MSRAAAPPNAVFMPEASALRAPSRGRQAPHRPVPFRSYGPHSAGPLAQATGAPSRPPNRPPAGAPQAVARTVAAAAAAPAPRHPHSAAAAATASGPGKQLGGGGAAAAAAASFIPRRNVATAAYRGVGGFRQRQWPPPLGFPPYLPHPHQSTCQPQHQHQPQSHLAQSGPQGPRPGVSGRSSLFPAARAQWAADARFRLHAAKSSAATTSASGQSSGALQVGSLVEFEKNDRGVLAVLVAQDGKKNWFAADASGRRTSIAPKQVQLVLPGGGYSEGDVAAYVAAAEGADMGLMEIAWEIAAESGAPLDLRELATLLYDDTTPKSLYITHRMLRKDTLYFKPAPRSAAAAAAAAPYGAYVPRSADDVAALRRQQEAAEAARQAAEAWRSAVAGARSAKSRSQQPSAAEWAEGPFADRIAALRAVALSSGQQSGPRLDESALALARSSLQLATSASASGVVSGGGGGGGGSRADPDAAADLLTEIGALRRHEPLQLLRRGLPLTTPQEQEREAMALLASPPPDPDAATREDLTALPVFTIDDASTTEIDDGLSLERLADGGIRIWIHVADPTRWIRPGSGLDAAGAGRTRTLYLPWGSLPMFPRVLAEGPFSLREGQVCDAMSVCVVLGRDGSLQRPRVVPSRVRVSHKLTYDQADAVLAAAAAAATASAEGAAAAGAAAVEGFSLNAAAAADLVALREAALARHAYRQARGCIEIPLPEAKIHVPYSHLDRARPAVTITRVSQWESASRALVAEMMILAGEAVGAIGSEAALPLPYRGQDAPELPPPEVLEALPEGPCRGFALKRCMTRSVVGPQPLRHASLALDAYVQFTSPIRRYSDMVAHHNLKAWLRGEALPFSAGQIESLMAAAGETGRELGAAERESDNYWLAEYLRLNWGAEYPAVALGWQREDLQLAAFLLEREGLEVVVRLPAGAAGAESFAPGNCCVLVPSEVNPATGFYRFYLAGWTSGVLAEVEGEGEEGEEVVE
ncbi:hypothetical protein PLESTM_001558100, partial [Pleodorina starrii]